MNPRHIIYLLLFISFPNGAEGADQLGCTTSSECFVACCPDGNPVCSQLCRNSCSGYPSSCPGHYHFCKYNTYVATWNWLELVNLTTSTISGSFQYYDSNGVPVGSSVEWSLNPLQRRDFDVHSVVGSSVIGQAVVSLDGSADALSGSVSYYEHSSGGVSQSTSTVCEKRARVIE